MKPYDEKVVPLDGDGGASSFGEAIAAFVDVHSFPLIVPFTEAFEEEIFDSLKSKPQLVVIGGKASLTQHEAVLTNVAKAFRGDALVVYADSASDDSHGLVDYFRVERGEVPCGARGGMRMAQRDERYKHAKSVSDAR